MSTLNEKATPTQTIAEMRFVSNSTGLVYEAQVEQLKKLANLFFHKATTTFKIDQNNRFCSVEVLPKNTNLQDELSAKFPDAVRYVLGDSWKVTVYYEQPKPAKPRGKRNNPKPSGKKRTRPLRRK
jgi:hypothetical protein